MKEQPLNNVLLRFISRSVRLKRRAYFAKYIAHNSDFLRNRFKTNFKMALTKFFFSRLNLLRELKKANRFRWFKSMGLNVCRLYSVVQSGFKYR